MRIESFASAVAGTNRAWAAKETLRPDAILSKVKSQTWMFQPYRTKAKTTHVVTPIPKGYTAQHTSAVETRHHDKGGPTRTAAAIISQSSNASLLYRIFRE